MSITPAY